MIQVVHPGSGSVPNCYGSGKPLPVYNRKNYVPIIFLTGTEKDSSQFTYLYPTKLSDDMDWIRDLEITYSGSRIRIQGSKKHWILDEIVILVSPQ
jgi:hypothetical protein